MDFYPDGFPAKAIARVEAGKILAYRNLDKKREKTFSGIAAEELVRDCILRIFLVFAEELCTFGQEENWSVDRIDSQGNDSLRRLTIGVLFDKSPDLDQHWISNWDGSLTQDARQQFRQSREWRKYQELLLTVAAVQVRKPHPRTIENRTEGTAIGANINRLRKECGWSLDKLAKETGIDKKLILSHVNKGARPIPRILREYAQAFSKELGRKITAPDLEK